MKDSKNQPSLPFESKNPFEIVTDHIIFLLGKGVVPWRKPWDIRTGPPINFYTKKPYRGLNIFLLSGLGYRYPYFLTVNQIHKLGGRVKKNENGHIIVFGKIYKKFVEESTDLRDIFFIKIFTVFNVEQFEGIDLPEIQIREFKPVEEAKAILDNMPKPPAIRHGKNSAYYVPVEGLTEKFSQRIWRYMDYYYPLHLIGFLGKLSTQEAKRSKDGEDEEKRLGTF